MLAGKLKELVAVAVFLVVAKSVVFGQMRVGTFIGSIKETLDCLRVSSFRIRRCTYAKL